MPRPGLHAQREAAEAYIKSQTHEGWRLRRERYDDGGFSGGSMERPALRKLLADVAERRIDVIVVYKVDRLTRSLADFAKLVELFDSKGVSFVSVTQSFNTTSSMGRLTLNVLLSFAQFEREVTGERIRDKIAASKKKGIWMGGTVPLGYRVISRKLVIDEAEAATVQLIFERYLALGSLSQLQADLRQRGIRRRSRSRSSSESCDIAFSNGPLAHMLKNRMYLGELNHRGISYKGEHAAIIDPELFAAVQAKLTGNRNERQSRPGHSDALLLGRLFDDRGNVMTPSHAVKNGVRYRYYVSSVILQGRKQEAGSVARVAAREVESAVIDALRQHVPATANSDGAAALRSVLGSIGLRATLYSDRAELTWSHPVQTDGSALVVGSCQHQQADALPHSDDGDEAAEQRRRLTVPLAFTSQKRRREIILPAADPSVRPIRSSEQQNLVLSIAQGRAWLQAILAGSTIASIAALEKRTERMVRMTVSLAFLDPKLVKAILQGTLPRGVSVRRLVDTPPCWSAQWQILGLARPA